MQPAIRPNAQCKAILCQWRIVIPDNGEGPLYSFRLADSNLGGLLDRDSRLHIVRNGKRKGTQPLVGPLRSLVTGGVPFELTLHPGSLRHLLHSKG